MSCKRDLTLPSGENCLILSYRNVNMDVQYLCKTNILELELSAASCYIYQTDPNSPHSSPYESAFRHTSEEAEWTRSSQPHRVLGKKWELHNRQSFQWSFSSSLQFSPITNNYPGSKSNKERSRARWALCITLWECSVIVNLWVYLHRDDGLASGNFTSKGSTSFLLFLEKEIHSDKTVSSTRFAPISIKTCWLT